MKIHQLMLKKKSQKDKIIMILKVGHRMKIKDNEKIKKYLDFARQLKKLLNMRFSMTPVVVGALGIVLKTLEIRKGKLQCMEESKAYTTYHR